MGSGKTTIYDAIVFALLGVARATVQHVGGMGVATCPTVELRMDGHWEIQRSKRRNSLTVRVASTTTSSGSGTTTLLHDNAAQDWIRDKFGVTDKLLYCSCYMPYRRSHTSGLLMTQPMQRRELLQDIFASELNLSAIQERYKQLKGTTTAHRDRVCTALQSIVMCKPARNSLIPANVHVLFETGVRDIPLSDDRFRCSKRFCLGGWVVVVVCTTRERERGRQIRVQYFDASQLRNSVVCLC
jgi:hypothetical protein